jgi:hypothetical protein
MSKAPLLHSTLAIILGLIKLHKHFPKKFYDDNKKQGKNKEK